MYIGQPTRVIRVIKYFRSERKKKGRKKYWNDRNTRVRGRFTDNKVWNNSIGEFYRQPIQEGSNTTHYEFSVKFSQILIFEPHKRPYTDNLDIYNKCWVFQWRKLRTSKFKVWLSVQSKLWNTELRAVYTESYEPLYPWINGFFTPFGGELVKFRS